MYRYVLRAIGGLGLLAYIVVFARTPSFPTPDKIFVFLVLLGLALGQAWQVIKRFGPFVVLLLVYESFRGLATHLNSHVHFMPMVHADRFLGFGTLPTTTLQRWLWHGHVTWYDFVFYGAYTLHFVLPFALAVLIWKTREKYYWHFITSLVILSFAGFITYAAFPAAPPWMASDLQYIEPMTRVSSQVWAAFGIHDFPSVYNKISPNPVAAVPSLHAAYSFLFAWFVTRLYKTRWKYLAWLYPGLIWFGTVYMGEHYVIDAILGVLYAMGAYKVAPYIVNWLVPIYKNLQKKLHQLRV
jgi:hypothetical protein